MAALLGHEVLTNDYETVPSYTDMLRVAFTSEFRRVKRAWAWRRRLERGEAITLQDIARVEQVTDRYVSRILRLAYLSPEVLERLLLWRIPPAGSVADLIKLSYLPWVKQMGLVFAQT